MRVKKAVIPVAGLGTRFLPATKAQPKEMLPIVNIPAIQLVIEEAVASGIETVVMVTGRNKRVIEEHFDQSPELEWVLQKKNKDKLIKDIRELSDLVEVCFVSQEEPLGLGHAILCAQKVIDNEPFAVLLADEIIDSNPPALMQLLNVYEEKKEPLIAVQEVSMSQISQYGVAYPVGTEHNPIFNVKKLVEKPTIVDSNSRFAMIGRYILTPNIFKIIKQTSIGKGNELQLTDALQNLCTYQRMSAVEIQGKRYDIGQPMGYIQANIEYALKREEFHSDFSQYLVSLTESWKGE